MSTIESEEGNLLQNYQKPIRRSLCSTIRHHPHWKCLLLSLLVSVCIGAVIWCRLATVSKFILSIYDLPNIRTNTVSACDGGYMYIPLAFIFLLYFVYLLECWYCQSRNEVKNRMSVEAAYEFLQDLRSAIPVVWWKVQCYHYVRKTRQVTRYRNGDAFTTMQVYYERINSQTRSAAFNWSHCGARDASKTLIGLENFFATRIKFTKGFSFCSIDSEVEFDMQRSSFFHAQERNDDYMETREGLDLLHVPFKSNLMVYSSRTPWYISQCVYWIFSFILLSWPLRILIEYNTAYVHYHILKVFGCSSTPHLSREATMCSSDLEHLVQRNYDIVPSYSEALLIDNSATQHRHVARMHNPADALVLQNPHALLTSSVSVPNGILFDYGSMKGRKKSLKNCSGKSNNSLTTPASGSDCQMPPGYEEALNMRLINDYATPTSNSTNSLRVFETEL